MGTVKARATEDLKDKKISPILVVKTQTEMTESPVVNKGLREALDQVWRFVAVGGDFV